MGGAGHMRITNSKQAELESSFITNMKATLIFLVISVFALTSAAQVNLQEKYPFSVVLLDDGENYYGLHWNFTRATETIYFAVNVSTTGWVGFGLSPNGQMPNSDVVIGWVSGEQTYFHDRFAVGRFLPPIDESQDWELDNSEEENGFTLLEFSRSFVTCDSRDFPITTSTDRVVWSFNPNDPTPPNGEDAMRHTMQGSRTINLLGGEPGVNTAPLESEPFLDITVSNVTIPAASTTYWCEFFRLPPPVANVTHFINRISPKITPHASSLVHHIVVSLCNNDLSEEDLDTKGPCNSLRPVQQRCSIGPTLAGWAVGGEDFVYPNGIAFPVGGTGQDQVILMEMHYDNPDMTTGVVDSSGMRFYYTTEEPQHRAGTLSIGHDVTPAMIVPPKSRNFTIAGICSADCTNTFIPKEGIRVFGDFLHTHLIGRGLTLQQYRLNTECNVLEEVEPIDQNLNYDFNFQQTVHLRRERLVLPGDILVLNCFYETATRDEVTIGGESTREEMCLSFLNYYPAPADGSVLDICISTPDLGTSFNDFYNYLLRINPAAAAGFADSDRALDTLNGLDWEGDPKLSETLQSSVLNSTVTGFCSAANGAVRFVQVKTPEPKCTYEAPDTCSEVQPKSCCERLTDGAPPQVQATSALFLLLGVLAAKIF